MHAILMLPCKHSPNPDLLGKPHRGVCACCWHYVNRPAYRELYDNPRKAVDTKHWAWGDWLAKVLTRFKRKKCNPCRKRQAKLNRLGRWFWSLRRR